jgi:hypothetical protein
VLRGVGRQPPDRLLELALAADAIAAAGLIPGDRDVDEALQELALGRLGRSPRVLELLVRGEILAVADQLEPAFKRVRYRFRGAFVCDQESVTLGTWRRSC